MAASAARHGAPVRPREPPTTQHVAARELRRGRRAARAPRPATPRADEPDRRLDRLARAGCRCRRPAPRRRAPCPGGSTGRAWRGGTSRSRSARTATPATSPVEASTPLGTSPATTGAPGVAERHDRLARPARAASPDDAGAEHARRPRPPRPRGSAASNGSGGSPGSRSRFARASPLSLSAVAVSASRDLAPGLAQQPRGDEPVAAVVALAAHDDDGPAGRDSATRSASPAPAASIRSSEGTPRSSIAHASVARICSASGSGSSQAGRLIARGPPRPPSPFEWVSETSTSRAGAARPCSATSRGPSSDLDVLPRPRLERERLGHRLLRAEARGEVLAGPRAGRGVGALALGEQPLGQPRPALERALQALDLQQVHADAAHGRGP